MLAPRYPAAVVAGNVETSQHVVDAHYAALGVMANAQGSMNNFTFGDETRQYYETICGGAGATADRAGTSAVHTHMTNSRLTDPEILERRFPVRVEDFSKIIPSTRFFNGSNSTPRLRRSLSSMPRRITLTSSSGVQSIRERKCLALIINYLFCNDRRCSEPGFSEKRARPAAKAARGDERGEGAIL